MVKSSELSIDWEFVSQPRGGPARVATPMAELAEQTFGRRPVGERAETSAVALPGPGEVLLLTGPSGGGKSTMLRELIASAGERRVIDVARLRLRPLPSVDQFESSPPAGPRSRPASRERLQTVLGRLTRVGLGEASVFLATPTELSDGQRWRLRLAVALWRAERLRQPAMLVADEFTSLLDRVSAQAVAQTLRRSVQGNISAIVASCDETLCAALRPDRAVWCEL